MRRQPTRDEIRQTVRACYLAFLFLCGCSLWPAAVSAQTNAWKGGAGNWSDSTKWTAGVPSSTSNVLIDNGNAVASAITMSSGAQSANLTIDSDDSLTMVDGALFYLYGPTVSNAGTFAITSISSGAVLNPYGAVTLTGAGALTMSNNANNTIWGYGQIGGTSLINQSTIQGSGSINPGSSNTFSNQHIVNANQTSPLIINAGSGTVTNTGTLESTNGGTLLLEGDSYGNGTFNNTSGTIQAGAGSIVQLYDTAIVKNGNLTATSTGATQCNGSNGFCKLDGVTITGTHQVILGGEFLANTITNNGSFQMGTNSANVNLDIVGNVTLKGTGTLTMANLAGITIFGYGQASGAVLTNQSTIQGAGNISPNTSNTFINQQIVNANQTTPLTIHAGSGTVTNTGTLEATSGGTLVLYGDAYGNGTFDNTGGTIHADAGSVVLFRDSAIIKNGNLTSTSTGKTQCNGSNGACTLDGVTITGTHQITTSYENLTNTVTNNGSFQMLGTSSNNVNIDILGSAVLAGSGTLTMGGSGNNIFAFYQPSPGNTLTNRSTIQGGGTINPSSGNTFINENIVNANKSTPLIINGNFTNAKNGTVIGTLKVAKPSTLYISGGLFGNFSGNTLTGGKYMVTGTLQFDGAYIVNNAAAITLTGSTSRIINQSASDALVNLATNTSAGSFSVMSGRLFTTTIQNGVFTNAGKVTVGVNSGFQVTAPPQNPPVYGTYNQTAGTTTVDGVLTAQGGVTINKGNLMGKGTIAASVVSSGAVTAGDSATKPGTLSVSTYTQKTSGTAIGSLVIPITSDTAFGQLAVSNGAVLSGPLTIKRLSTYLPAIGRTYTVLTAGTITGSFFNSTVAINSGEHFAISYDTTTVPQTVTVSVASGP